MEIIKYILTIVFEGLSWLTILFVIFYKEDEYNEKYTNAYGIIYFASLWIIVNMVFPILKLNNLYLLLIATIPLIIISIFKFIFKIGLDPEKIKRKQQKEKENLERWEKIKKLRGE